MDEKLKNGIDLNLNTVVEMIRMGEYLGIDTKKYFGDVDVTKAKKSIYE